MERRISSAFTEFYKVHIVLSVVIFFVVFGPLLFSTFSFSFSLFFLLANVINLFFVFDFWKMKEVEMTDAGLLISSRKFFNQQTIFVPYEKIETVKNKFWWLGNKKRVLIRFTEETNFGKEISFISRGFTIIGQSEIIEELNRTVIRNKTSEKIKSALVI